MSYSMADWEEELNQNSSEIVSMIQEHDCHGGVDSGCEVCQQVYWGHHENI